MASYSSTVKVISVSGEDFGAVATIEPVQPSVGIDATIGGLTQVQITEDAAGSFKVGAYLEVTFSDNPSVHP